MNREPFYQLYLKNEMQLRSQLNSRYGIRAFANYLEIGSGALSQILNGKRIPSLKTALKILDKLCTDYLVRCKFLQTLAQTHEKRNLKRQNKLIKEYKHSEFTSDLSVTFFETIYHWYYGAILELTFHDDFKYDLAWIALKLGLKQSTVKAAISDLLKLGLLVSKQDTLKKASVNLKTGNREYTSQWLKYHQKQILEKSLESLLNDDIEKRHHSEITMCIDPEKIPEAKLRIQKFASDLCNFLETKNRKEIYSISLSLFPLKERINIKD